MVTRKKNFVSGNFEVDGNRSCRDLLSGPERFQRVRELPLPAVLRVRIGKWIPYG